MKEAPLLSVLIPTYDHEEHIVDCIEGVLMQETDFEFEVLIGEDDSNDRTREICIDYSKSYPEKIRLFLNERKDVIYINGRPTGRRNLLNLLSQARGKYIALCEGDDRWIDKEKLQKQVDILENNEDLSFCFHDCYIEEKGKYRKFSEKRVTQGADSMRLDSYDLLGSFNAPVQTATFVGRNFDTTELPHWFYTFPSGDRPLFVYLSTFGDGYYFNSIMSVYKKHDGNLSKRIIDDNLINIHKRGLYDMADYLNQHINNDLDYRKAAKCAFFGYLFIFYMKKRRHHLNNKNYLKYFKYLFKVFLSKKYSFYNFRDILYVFRKDFVN